MDLPLKYHTSVSQLCLLTGNFEILWSGILQQPPNTLADPGGGAAGARPPNRINFFCFRIRFHQKVYTSEIGAHPQRVGAPPTGNPGSATEIEELGSRKSSVSTFSILTVENIYFILI